MCFKIQSFCVKWKDYSKPWFTLMRTVLRIEKTIHWSRPDKRSQLAPLERENNV